MDNAEVKEKLHHYIESGDETLINMMWEVVSGYNSKNMSSTIDEYNKDIEESLEQFKKGEFLNQREMEEQSEKW